MPGERPCSWVVEERPWLSALLAFLSPSLIHLPFEVTSVGAETLESDKGADAGSVTSGAQVLPL